MQNTTIHFVSHDLVIPCTLMTIEQWHNQLELSVNWWWFVNSRSHFEELVKVRDLAGAGVTPSSSNTQIFLCPSYQGVCHPSYCGGQGFLFSTFSPFYSPSIIPFSDTLFITLYLKFYPLPPSPPSTILPPHTPVLYFTPFGIMFQHFHPIFWSHNLIKWMNHLHCRVFSLKWCN